jgi:hypothetical protein
MRGRVRKAIAWVRVTERETGEAMASNSSNRVDTKYEGVESRSDEMSAGEKLAKRIREDVKTGIRLRTGLGWV